MGQDLPYLHPHCSVSWTVHRSRWSWSAMSNLNRSTQDPDELPIDFRVFDEMLGASSGREVGIGDFAVGVRVGPGVAEAHVPEAVFQEEEVEE